MVMENYFKELRSKIGQTEIIMPGVAGVLFNQNRDQVLMEKRGDGSKDWGLVSGMQNLGESATESIIREFKEETNLDVTVTALIGIDTNFHHVFPNGDQAQIPMFLFEVECLGGQPIPDGDETLELAYVALQPVPKMYNPQHQLAVNQLAKKVPYGWFF
ncbi:hydrolase [Weissella oryzae SG25]|uniref:Hydrolase n=1 Tax=Weissella oryzae (strain DSM 25784 / JCM 18191 / LMG 30913 / SG25) TaxID=1329250 RepID=A0A069CVS4_WEIOS|nr:NUDIX domain-containing protein [Weissella oryzae]GAK31293.1 hydrolase [Weissella oryzae SG25]